MSSLRFRRPTDPCVPGRFSDGLRTHRTRRSSPLVVDVKVIADLGLFSLGERLAVHELGERVQFLFAPRAVGVSVWAAASRVRVTSADRPPRVSQGVGARASRARDQTARGGGGSLRVDFLPATCRLTALLTGRSTSCDRTIAACSALSMSLERAVCSLSLARAQTPMLYDLRELSLRAAHSSASHSSARHKLTLCAARTQLSPALFALPTAQPSLRAWHRPKRPNTAVSAVTTDATSSPASSSTSSICAMEHSRSSCPASTRDFGLVRRVCGERWALAVCVKERERQRERETERETERECCERQRRRQCRAVAPYGYRKGQRAVRSRRVLQRRLFFF